MNAEKPNFLSQPEVKNIYFFRNGDPYYKPRRLVINAKRVSTFDTLLREVTGGVQAQFGAVRNIYTPKGGHRVDSMEHLRSGEQYVAAGREKFKKIDYLQIGTRKKRTLQPNGLLKPVPQSRMIVSARFLKPIKEPCTIFVVANGDVLNPAVRFLIPNRLIGQFERILEMIAEKMRLKIVGGVRSLYTFDGTLIMEGKELENGQFYVAVGRDKFKRLPYSDLLFNKPIGHRVYGSKAASLPPIYKYRRQNGDHHISKSVVGGSECGQDKISPPAQSSNEQLSSFVREISQARLMTIRKKRSGLTTSHEAHDNDDVEDRGAEDDKSSPEEGLTVKQEAEEASPDPDQEDNSQVQTDIDGSSNTETIKEPADSEPADPDQTTEESQCNGEEEKKPEDENTGEDEKKEMEEEECKEKDGEIKEEEETSEIEANNTNEVKKEEETDAEGEETQNEEETAEESEQKEQQVEGEEEGIEEKPENEGNQTEESPDQSEELSANTE